MGDGRHVLVTGGSGFVASHIINGLVKQDYAVTATVRSPARGQEILALHPEWKANLDFAYVQDIAVDGAFDDLFKNAKSAFSFIIHTASPVNFAVKDLKKDLVDPAVQGCVGLLQSAHKYGGAQLKRFVLLGSAVAILNSFEDISVAGNPYTEKDWNPVTLSDALEANSPVLAYNFAKKQAEIEAWHFLSTNKPSFDLAVINPDIIIGPLIQPVSDASHVNETCAFAVYNFLNGEYKSVVDQRFPFYHFVDVRNVARAHIIAMTAESAKGKRILQVGGQITPQAVVNIIYEHFPNLRARLPGKPSDQILPEGNQPTGWDVSASSEVLSQGGGERWEYIGLEQSVIDTVRSLMEWEGKWHAGEK